MHQFAAHVPTQHSSCALRHIKKTKNATVIRHVHLTTRPSLNSLSCSRCLKNPEHFTLSHERQPSSCCPIKNAKQLDHTLSPIPTDTYLVSHRNHALASNAVVCSSPYQDPRFYKPPPSLHITSEPTHVARVFFTPASQSRSAHFISTRICPARTRARRTSHRRTKTKRRARCEKQYERKKTPNHVYNLILT